MQKFPEYDLFVNNIAGRLAAGGSEANQVAKGVQVSLVPVLAFTSLGVIDASEPRFQQKIGVTILTLLATANAYEMAANSLKESAAQYNELLQKSVQLDQGIDQVSSQIVDQFGGEIFDHIGNELEAPKARFLNAWEMVANELRAETDARKYGDEGQAEPTPVGSESSVN